VVYVGGDGDDSRFGLYSVEELERLDVDGINHDFFLL